jgi:hypothetical protein
MVTNHNDDFVELQDDQNANLTGIAYDLPLTGTSRVK